jgi:hypothetical protein
VLGGTFSIYANDYTAYAMRIHGRAYESSHQIVVGVFHIFALRHEAAGIVIEGSINSRLDVYGIFDICSSTDAIIPNTNAYGV